jgi:hypothetical protein
MLDGLINLPALVFAVTPELPARLVTIHIGRSGEPTISRVIN